jgi:hypothetical protein
MIAQALLERRKALREKDKPGKQDDSDDSGSWGD